MWGILLTICILTQGKQLDGPPAVPPWKSPSPYFPSSWFGANMKTFEFNDPREVAKLTKYKQILTSWPMLVLTTNFTNGTQIQIEDATTMKKLFGKNASVFTYQSQWVASHYYPEVYAIIHKPEYSDFFLKDVNGTLMEYTGYCSQCRVSATDYPTCLGYYWNYCNESAVEYYINTVLKAMVAYPNGTAIPFDGVFLDNSEGFSTRHTSNAKCNQNTARMNVHIKTGKMFQKYDKWPVFSGGYSPATVEQVWAAGVGFTKFYEYFSPQNNTIQNLLDETEMGLPTIVHSPTAVKRHPGIPLLDAYAAYLIAAGGATHSYFQYSAANWVVDSSWKWSSLYDIEIGAALGPPTVTLYGPNNTGTVWTRKFVSGVEVMVNCTPKSEQTRFEWCHGNVTQPKAQ